MEQILPYYVALSMPSSLNSIFQNCEKINSNKLGKSPNLWYFIRILSRLRHKPCSEKPWMLMGILAERRVDG